MKKKPSRKTKLETEFAQWMVRRDAHSFVYEEVLAVLIAQSDVAATLAVLEARFRLLAQDPPRGVRGADITRVAKPLLALFRSWLTKPRLIRQAEGQQP